MGKNIIIVGTQWGDEGKGKIIDWLCTQGKIDAVVRFQGGHNAGHTVIVNGKKMVFRLIPSGILNEHVKCLLGNGIVLNIDAFIKELDELKKNKINIKNRLFISARCSLLLDYHIALDAARESMAKNPIGTTKRGIGLAYEDKVARRGLRAEDLFCQTTLKEKLIVLADYHNFQLKHYYHQQTIPYQKVLDKLLHTRDELIEIITNVTELLDTYHAANQSILFEGAQGTLLDLDFGTYPYVTSSNTISAGAAMGTGFGFNQFNAILGITKTYITRVGEGPFLTEQKNEIGQRLATAGAEFGSVTNRPRRCGWLDLVLLRYASQINALSGLIITKPDVLDEFDEIKVCTAYQYQGKLLKTMPYSPEVLSKCVPIYDTLPGWKCSTSGITAKDKLPKNLLHYLDYIEKAIGKPIVLLSTGPERHQTITMQSF
jgi:adenylosuccinate synthase